MQAIDLNSDSFGCYSSLADETGAKLLYSSATCVYPAEEYRNYGFIAVFGLAQRLHIEFLPLVWEEARGMIGFGGQARISQALINLRSSFAFKRFDHYGPQDPFHEIVQEMTVLIHPLIRQHQNIVRLEGMCWDITTERDEIWPVLVFEKTQLGDLSEFMKSNKGKSLSIEDRLEICADIGTAIKVMHSNSKDISELEPLSSLSISDVVHGDIKPSNVLIFQEASGRYTAKVADFGYSTLFRCDDNLISVPISIPWNDPEHQGQNFQPSEAKRIDVYSFSLLCQWLIFGLGTYTNIALPPGTAITDSQVLCFEIQKQYQKENLLLSWKNHKGDKLLEWATWLVSRYANLAMELENNLMRFFRSSLRFTGSLGAATFGYNIDPQQHSYFSPVLGRFCTSTPNLLAELLTTSTPRCRINQLIVGQEMKPDFAII